MIAKCQPLNWSSATSCRRTLAVQWQLGGWCALICTLQSVANMKTKDWDIKQVISAMT
jgi:hypothetical protein